MGWQLLDALDAKQGGKTKGRKTTAVVVKQFKPEVMIIGGGGGGGTGNREDSTQEIF